MTGPIGEITLPEPQRRITLTASNVGKGVAYRIRPPLLFWQEASADISDIDLSAVHGERVYLAGCYPSTAKVSDTVTCVAFVPARALEDIERRSGAFLFYGSIEYCDSLDIPRHDPICWRSSWKPTYRLDVNCQSWIINMPLPRDKRCS